MSECQLMCSSVVDCERCAQAKRIVEGECCALAYNEDGDWFDDEDEEFSFENSSGWFEDAFVALWPVNLFICLLVCLISVTP